jgi:hypothetical protein
MKKWLPYVVHRHRPMVYRASWQFLQPRHEAEVAFRTPVLMLALNLGMVRKLVSPASWLRCTLRRVALKAKAQLVGSVGFRWYQPRPNKPRAVRQRQRAQENFGPKRFRGTQAQKV